MNSSSATAQPLSSLSLHRPMPVFNLEESSSIKIQKLFRGFSARKSFLPSSLFENCRFECEHINDTTPRAIDGKTPVFLPSGTPQIVIKQTGVKQARARFQKMEALRAVIEKKNWSHFAIPRVRLCNGYLIEERFPINTNLGYNANLYLSNLDRCENLVREFAQLFFTSAYIDYLVQKNFADSSVIQIRYDNIPFLERGQTDLSVALIDLERSHIGTTVKSVAHRLYILASLFPFHISILEEEAAAVSIPLGEQERFIIESAVLHAKRYLQRKNQEYLATKPLTHPIPSQNHITYEYFGGRFGDNLMTYLHAKWLSYKHNIPLLYKPFPYSTELALDAAECRHHPERQETFEEVRLRREFTLQSGFSTAPQIYSVHYFPESAWEKKYGKRHNGKPWIDSFEVDWKDAGFRKEIRPLLQPKIPLALITPPKDRISIAIHFREGGGFDLDIATLNLPLKFPPFDFYSRGLLEIIKSFPGSPIYCYLFTDAKYPKLYLDQLKALLPKEADIVLDCRAEGNAHNAHVLKDFFSLSNFDALIYPQSHFSMIPALTYDYSATCTVDSDTPQGNIDMKIEILEPQRLIALDRLNHSP